eukprot:SAG31_NODE_8640_length_1416_cov_0.951405_1_plen_293_part_01
MPGLLMALQPLLLLLLGALLQTTLAIALPSVGCSRSDPPLSPPGQLDSHLILVSEPLVPLGAHFRHFRIQLPSSYKGDAPPLPLVLDFHGFGSTSMIQYQNSGFANITDGRNFIGVWPDGSGDCLAESPGCDHSWENCSCCSQGWNALGTSEGYGPGGQHSTCNSDRKAWGYYDCYASCGAACQPSPEDNTTETCISSSCWDDIGFISQLLDHLEARLCFDLDRVHLSGAFKLQPRTIQCTTAPRLPPSPRTIICTHADFHPSRLHHHGAGLSNGAMFAYNLVHSRRVGPRIA